MSLYHDIFCVRCGAKIRPNLNNGADILQRLLAKRPELEAAGAALLKLEGLDLEDAVGTDHGRLWEFLAFFAAHSGHDLELRKDYGDLVLELPARPRQLRKKEMAAKARKKAKRSARRVHQAETSSIYTEVMARAGGGCEYAAVALPEDGPPLCMGLPVMDHFRGRGKAQQTVENCWALCVRHNLQKTDNVPDAALWVNAFIRHCEKHGYTTEAELARGKLAKVTTRAIFTERLDTAPRGV